MKNNFSLLDKYKKFIINNNNYSRPFFKNSNELFKWNQEQGEKYTKNLIKKNQRIKIEKNLELSGIRKLHMECTFENYKVECIGQQIALNRAKEYLAEFEKGQANFIFSGKSGTGKNHLTAAISKKLILKGKKVIVITISDLMSNIKNSFFGNFEEEKLLNKLSNVDLLVIDEIGIQSESRYEKVIINQIIDRRSSSKLKTGMLSNLDSFGMNKILGERVIDRMRLGQGFWVCFNWESYRSRIK